MSKKLPHLPIYNYLPAEYKQETVKYKNYNEMQIDIPFQWIIEGQSGSKKTQCMLNLIRHFGCFQRIWLIAKDLEEPLYKWVAHVGKDVITTHDSLDELPDLDTPMMQDRKLVKLLILDDVIAEKKKDLERINEYFIRCRKLNVSIFLLSQNFFSIPTLIRRNMNRLTILRLQTNSNIKKILGEYITNHKDLDRVVEIWRKSLDHQNDFFSIDLKSNDPNRKYFLGYRPLASLAPSLTRFAELTQS